MPDESPEGGFPEDPLLDPAATPAQKAEQVHAIFQSLVATLTEEEARAVSDRFSQAMALVARREVLTAMESLRREILQALREAPAPAPEVPLVMLSEPEEATSPSAVLGEDYVRQMQQRIAGSIREVLYEAAGLKPGAAAAGLPDETVRRLARGLTHSRLRRRRH